MRLKGFAFVVFVLSLVTAQSFAQTFINRGGLSAARSSGESYEDASSRVRAFNGTTIQGLDRGTPESFRVALKDIELEEIPEVSAEDLQAHFEYIRDTRFFEDSSLDFPRRVSWLYPDDGCYIRAEMASHYLQEQKFTAPKKLFVFGSLKAMTKNSRSGYVEWWYHVAVTYRVGNVAYVYDPAMNPKTPMTLQEWNAAVGGGRTSVKYALCAAEAVDPDSACHTGSKRSYTSVFHEQLGFLSDEWDRIESLRRDPKKELGDSPPWLQVNLRYAY